MMEINEFEHTSLLHSISNLATIKALHDLGCDVNKLSLNDFYDDVQFGKLQSFAILESGLKQLYPSTMKFLEYDDISGEEYKHLFTEMEPEFCILWEDPVLLAPLRDLSKKEFDKLRASWKYNGFHVDMDYELVPSSSAIAFYFHFYGMVHEVIPLIKQIERTAIMLKRGENVWNTISA